MSDKQQLQQSAEHLLLLAQNASESAQYAQGQCDWEEKRKADSLWAEYYEAVRIANECPA